MTEYHNDSLLLTSLNDTYREIVSWRGVYSILPSGELDYFIHGCGENQYLINYYTEPTFEIFKDSNLGDAKELVRSTGVFAIGEYKIVNKKYVGRCALKPDMLFIYQYQKQLQQQITENTPNVYFFDIETYSKPNTVINMEKYPILGIGYSINDGKPILNHIKEYVDQEYIDSVDVNDAPTDEKLLAAEREILLNFFDVIDENNIDILVGFNSAQFDLPYILIRARHHKLPITVISKLFRYNLGMGDDSEEINKNLRIKLNQLISPNKKINTSVFNLLGRTHIDIYHSWYNMAMKDIALKLELIDSKVDVDATRMWHEYTKNYDLFMKYFYLDIEITRELFLRNFSSWTTELETLNCGLNFIATATASTLSTYKFYSKLTENNIAVTKSPYEFNPAYILFGTSLFNSDNRTKFPGANTGVEQQGSFENIVKLDVTSFYPNLIRSFKLGVSNTYIIGILPYQNKYKFVKDIEGKYLDYYVPDKKLNITFRIRKFFYTDPIPSIVQKAQEDRVVFKRKAQDAEKNFDIAKVFLYENISNSMKVINNSMYGILGLGTQLGNLASAILTTTLGRFHIGLLNGTIKSKVKQFGGKYNPVIEIDTDGVVYAYNFGVDECNEILKQITEFTGASYESEIKLDADYDKMFWSKSTKNYVLAKYDENGDFYKWKIAGSSLHGQTKTKLEATVLTEFCDKHIIGKMSTLDFLSELKSVLFEDNFEKYPINEFIMPRKNLKAISEYGEGSQNQKLAIQYEEIYGVKPEIKSTLDYIVVLGMTKYLLATDDNLKKIINGDIILDKNHYYDKCVVMIEKNA